MKIVMKRNFGIKYRIVGQTEEHQDNNFLCVDEEEVKEKAIIHYRKKGIDIEILEVYEVH